MQGQAEKPESHHFHNLHNVSEVVGDEGVGLKIRPSSCRHQLLPRQGPCIGLLQGAEVYQVFH